MGRQRNNKRRGLKLRQELAAEAARIMATEGQRSFLTAKQKAAARLGLAPNVSMPTNAEVSEALKAWHALYGGQGHLDNLTALRRTALDAMRLFSDFHPKLAGPVLEGTADNHSRVTLHLFADDPDAVLRFLLERNLPFQQESRRIRWHDGSQRDIEILVMEAGGHAVELMMMIGRDALQSPPSPVDGRPQQRIGPSELERLLDQSAPVASL